MPLTTAQPRGIPDERWNLHNIFSLSDAVEKKNRLYDSFSFMQDVTDHSNATWCSKTLFYGWNLYSSTGHSYSCNMSLTTAPPRGYTGGTYTFFFLIRWSGKEDWAPVNVLGHLIVFPFRPHILKELPVARLASIIWFGCKLQVLIIIIDAIIGSLILGTCIITNLWL